MKALVQRDLVIIKKCDLAVEVTGLGSLPSTEPTARNLCILLPHQIFLQGLTSCGSSSSSSMPLTPLIISCISGSSIFIFILPSKCSAPVPRLILFSKKDLQRSEKIERCACVRLEQGVQRVSCIYSAAHQQQTGESLGASEALQE